MSICSTQDSVLSLPKGWTKTESSSGTKFFTLSESSSSQLVVSRCLNVNSDGTWTLMVYGREVNQTTCTSLHNQSAKLRIAVYVY